MKWIILLIASVAQLAGQGLDPALLLKPGDTWPMYYGDYSGRRYSPLSQINRSNVGSLTVAWSFRTNAVPVPTGDVAVDRSSVTLTSVPIQVGGVLYFTMPDHVWAVDARTARLVWHFYRPSPGIHITNRGVALHRSRLFVGTPDAHVIALDSRTGKKLWDVVVGDVTVGQAITMAPVVVRDLVIVSSSGDGADTRGFVAALDPETGKTQWQWHAVPSPGQPGADTWPYGKEAPDLLAYGGGNPSMTPTYDPDLNLLYVGTGGPRPAMAGDSRRGSNLYTCSIVALNANTGKMAWHFQASPHETHNWDSAQPPVLLDAQFRGSPRKLLAQASRNGYFFLLDRATGESLVSIPFVPISWSTGVDAKGQPIPKKDAEPKADGVLVSPGDYGATNWPPPSYSPDTKLFYVNANVGSYAMYYLTSKSITPKGLAGLARGVGRGTTDLLAIDYQTGKVRWTAEAGGFGGVLGTAGGLVLTSGASNSVLALDAETGKVLWHSRIGVMVSAAMTYELDGHQYLITPVEDRIFAWTLPGSMK